MTTLVFGEKTMNATVEWQEQREEQALASEEIRSALKCVVTSTAFAKAPRMCALLSFLMEKKLDGVDGGLTEYAIGMQLFRRDPAAYDTTIDPVVRVQVGRLRTRLADYYGAMKEVGVLQICIPAGSYMPVLRRLGPNMPTSGIERMELAPLRCLSLDAGNGAFADGLDEELCSCMFSRFPAMLQVREHNVTGTGDRMQGAQLRLEGSIRIEQTFVRASVRLVDTAAGHTVWTTQCDSSGMLGIALQEKLANAICDKLADHFRSRTNTA
jgi:TolB-like protein